MAFGVNPNRPLQQPVQGQAQAPDVAELDQNQIDGIFILATTTIHLQTLRTDELINDLNQRIDEIQGKKTCCETAKELFNSIAEIVKPIGEVAVPLAQVVAQVYPILAGAAGPTTTTTPAGVAAVETTIAPAPTT